MQTYFQPSNNIYINEPTNQLSAMQLLIVTRYLLNDPRPYAHLQFPDQCRRKQKHFQI